MTELPAPPKPIDWTPEARKYWKSVDRAQTKKNLSLLLIFAPYVIPALMMAAGGSGQTSDGRVMMAMGGGLLLIVIVVSPFLLPMAIHQWWHWRSAFRNHRRGFWQRYGVDPCLVFPPDEAKQVGPKAPWE